MSPPLEGFENSAQSMMGSWREGGPVPRSKQQPAEASMQQPADVRTDFTCAQRRESLAFLSDDVIARHPVYRALQGLACGVAHALHGFSVEGWKQVPKQKGVMLVSLHTTHSGDIGPCMLYGQKLSGRVVRGLLHRLLMATAPILRYIGGVPGYRDTAYELLRAGNWVAVVPGGAEEIMAHNSANGQNAYAVAWESKSGQQRAGFAKVAQSMGEGFQIFPCFCENGEEMRFNPIINLWTFLGLDLMCGRLIRMTPAALCNVLLQLAIVVTFVVSNFAIPVPVKVTQHIGEPVVVRSGESPEALAKRVQNALQNLIDRHQGRRHRSYWAALRDTWWPAVRAKRAGRGAGRGSLTQTG